MEVYTLDSLFRRTKVIDKFESMIWTERYNEYGDFELELKSTYEARSTLIPGVHLAQNNSHRVMTVETIEDRTDEDGQEMLTIKGRSIETVLQDRVAKYSLSNLATEPSWILRGSPKDISEEMFDHICRPPGALTANDEIPFITAGTMFPADPPDAVPFIIDKYPGVDILDPLVYITWEQKPDSLYNAIRAICLAYDLGFRLTRNYDNSELYFEVYEGKDRTTNQDERTPVLFSVGLDSIQNTVEFTSIQGAKNFAYVFSETGFVVTSAYGAYDASGFERRSIVRTAEVPSGEDPISYMQQIAGEELERNKGIAIFDGEIDPRSEYVYGVDYDLGDLVEMRNKDGVIAQKRVTEQIFVEDSRGERSYPTLSMGVFDVPNTWRSYGNDDIAWIDMATEYWVDM